VSHDLFRLAAIAAGVAIALAPFRATLAGWAVACGDVAKRHSRDLVRLAVIAGLLAVGSGVVTLPALPAAGTPTITVETPTVEMQQTVAPIAKAMASASPVDRALWASVWEKSAVIVSAAESGDTVVFTDTRSLRGFTVLGLDLAWRRLGGNAAGKYPGLRESVENAFRGVVGMDVVPVTPELRAKYAETCRAIAWAGVNGG
jgi:hypothetical protein